TGRKTKAGSIIVDGDVDTRMGISMVSGAIYIKGNVKQPVGNVVEVGSARQGYRKFVSITDILSEVSNEKILPPNVMENGCLYIRDGIIRDTIADRLDADRKVIVEGD
ncbi:MAG: formylmethanofuran dehydrogenase, partial [Candidatus Methanoperedens sp.]|nr:formylmethanofuran dehydrogenase [Candidatus Methanoperedens sp.]